MQFEVRAITNAAEVMHFMQELCTAKTHKWRGWRGDQPEQTFKHNQIAILECEILPIDREDFDHNSYEYGPDQVASVDLICEYVINKAAFEIPAPAGPEKGKAPETGKASVPATVTGKVPGAAAAKAPEPAQEKMTIEPGVVLKDITDAQTAKKR
jgi:hypothetical protein